MTKSGKLFSGMGGRFHPELVAGLFRNGWQVCARICTYGANPKPGPPAPDLYLLIFGKNNCNFHSTCLPLLQKALSMGAKSPPESMPYHTGWPPASLPARRASRPEGRGTILCLGEKRAG